MCRRQFLAHRLACVLMSTQLDILALEPFFGGIRRHMLETAIRCSRHRWTLLKLPPRRIERRLAVAANWFAEHLASHWSAKFDVLFTSEAMNLANLYELAPELAGRPSVVYFHDSSVPHSKSEFRSPAGRQFDGESAVAASTRPGANAATASPHQPQFNLDVINLKTAMAATEIWFNSVYHQRIFLAGGASLLRRNAEFAETHSAPSLTAKSHLMPPPIDLNLIPHVKSHFKNSIRDPRAIFVDTRDAQMIMLNDALSELASRGEQFRLITVGPVEELSSAFTRRTIPEINDAAHVAGLLEAGIILSVRPRAGFDLQVVRGLRAGCQPVLPEEGIYPELIPQEFHARCLYPFDADALADRLQDALNPGSAWDAVGFRPELQAFEAIAATRRFDERLSHLAPPR